MTLLHKTYGKGRVRVMRVHRDGDRHEVRELTVKAMLTGAFDRTFTDADNSPTVSTDTIKNVVYVVARECPTLPTEAFCRAVAQRLLDSYPQMEAATVTGHETRWNRLAIDGGRPLRARPFAPWPVFEEDERRAVEAVLASGTVTWTCRTGASDVDPDSAVFYGSITVLMTPAITPSTNRIM